MRDGVVLLDRSHDPVVGGAGGGGRPGRSASSRPAARPPEVCAIDTARPAADARRRLAAPRRGRGRAGRVPGRRHHLLRRLAGRAPAPRRAPRSSRRTAARRSQWHKLPSVEACCSRTPATACCCRTCPARPAAAGRSSAPCAATGAGSTPTTATPCSTTPSPPGSPTRRASACSASRTAASSPTGWSGHPTGSRPRCRRTASSTTSPPGPAPTAGRPTRASAGIGEATTAEGVEALWRQSPLRHVAHVRTPLLLLQGEADHRCPPGDAEQLFVALRALGREVDVRALSRVGARVRSDRTARPADRPADPRAGVVRPVDARLIVAREALIDEVDLVGRRRARASTAAAPPRRRRQRAPALDGAVGAVVGRGPLTTGRHLDHTPRIAPDGSAVAFLSEPRDGRRPGLAGAARRGRAAPPDGLQARRDRARVEPGRPLAGGLRARRRVASRRRRAGRGRADRARRCDRARLARRRHLRPAAVARARAPRADARAVPGG